MRYFILSDIHADWTALETVCDDMLEHFPTFGPKLRRFLGRDEETAIHILDPERQDKLVCLGDFIGYGPDPNLTLRFMDICDFVVPGNHDTAIKKYAMDPSYARDFNEFAASAVKWTKEELNDWSALEHLLNKSFSVKHKNVLFSHSTPFDAVSMNYINSPETADAYYLCHEEFKNTIAFVGHTHIPQIYTKEHDGKLWAAKIDGCTEKGIEPNEFTGVSHNDYSHILFVVPSVSQPRDHCNKIGWTLYDPEKETVKVFRIPYNINETQERMKKAKLPKYLIERLQSGY